MLLALTAFGTGMVLARHGNANVALESQLPALRAAADKPGAKLEDWVKYAQALESLKQYLNAIIAYQQALKLKYLRPRRPLGLRPACIAHLGKKDDLDRFIDETIHLAPETAKEFFDKPEVSIFLADARFQDLKQAAEAGGAGLNWGIPHEIRPLPSHPPRHHR